MNELLAAITTEGITTGAAGAAVLGAVTLLIKRGFHLDVGKTNGNGGKGGNSVSRNKIECEIIHTALEKLEEERHKAVVAGLGDVKTSIGKVHERIDELIKGNRT